MEKENTCAAHIMRFTLWKSRTPILPETLIQSALCDQTVEQVTDEQSKVHPSSIYGIAKQEQMILVGCKSLNIPAVSFRYQNVYGPGQSLSNPYTGILSIFSTRILNNNSINIFEDGLESRDFVFIDDVVDATIIGLESENANNQVYNVGSESTQVFVQ